MTKVLIIFYGIALAISILHLFVSAYIMTKRLNKRRKFENCTSQTFSPSVSILKPLKGIDDELEQNLRSFFELDYPNFELIFGLENIKDDAYQVVRKLVDEHKHVKAKIVINDFAIGLNPKINNLYNMEGHATGELILISDSNTRVPKDFLKKMIRAIDQPEIGLVTATIRGIGALKPAALMENLHINSYISPNVFVAESLTNIPVVIGKSILISKQLLQQIGGFAAFKDFLAEDYLLGLRVKQLGYQIKTIPVLVDNVNVNWSFKRFLNRHARWAKIRRNMHLHHYIIESFSNPIALAVILSILIRNLFGLELLVTVMFVKILHDFYVSKLLDSDLRWYHFALAPVKDLIISLIWLVPFFSYTVNWRGNNFKIGRFSTLRPAINQ